MTSEVIYIFILAVFFGIIWIWRKQIEKLKKEQGWIANIIKENPSLNEEELVEKIKTRFLIENSRINMPLTYEREIGLKEIIRQLLKEVKQSLKNYH